MAKARPKQKPNIKSGGAGSLYEVTGKGAKRISKASARVKQGDNKLGGRQRLRDHGT